MPKRAPTRCDGCGGEDTLTVCGPGVERLAEEAAGLFPDRRMIVLSSDFPGGTERLRRELEAVAEGEFDLVIGTQLVAKGHNFPGLALVGVIDADVGLTSGDPRAAERTFQLLQQVTGRAGRGHTAGRGLIQTHDPAHLVIQAILAGDSERFYAEEIRIREAAGLPPSGDWPHSSCPDRTGLPRSRTDGRWRGPRMSWRPSRASRGSMFWGRRKRLSP